MCEFNKKKEFPKTHLFLQNSLQLPLILSRIPLLSYTQSLSILTRKSDCHLCFTEIFTNIDLRISCSIFIGRWSFGDT